MPGIKSDLIRSDQMDVDVDVDPPSLTSSSISTVHPDIIETQILPRLDVSALASASCVSTQLNSLASNEALWTNFCHATWPSTNTPRMRHFISTFPKGPRSFFSDSVTNTDIATTSSSSPTINHDRPSELISAVDIYYEKRHVFSKIVETQSLNSSLFRVDLLDSEDSVPIRVPYPVKEHMMHELGERLTLSWILIDPIVRRTMNISSYKPLMVERRWVTTEEVHERYCWVFSAEEEGSATEHVKCGISVTWVVCESGKMRVSQVRLDMEDVYGDKMGVEDSLVILKKGMEGKRGNVELREEEGKRRYEEYMEMRREKIMSVMTKLPGRLDMFYLALRVFIFAFLRIICFKKFYV